MHPDKRIIVVGNVDDVLKGSPDNPQFSFKKIADGKISPIPLPDPATMIYPK